MQEIFDLGSSQILINFLYVSTVVRQRNLEEGNSFEALAVSLKISQKAVWKFICFSGYDKSVELTNSELECFDPKHTKMTW